MLENGGMETRGEIEQLDEQSYADCCSLLSRGNVTLQGGGMETQEGYDELLEEVLSVELGEG